MEWGEFTFQHAYYLIMQSDSRKIVDYITISKSDIKSNTMTYFLFVFDRVKTEYRPGRQILNSRQTPLYYLNH